MAKTIDRAQARAQKLKRYFTGKPCSRGHIAERYVSRANCCTCNKEDMAALVAKNPEKLRAYRRKWAAHNPEKLRAAIRSWHKANKKKDCERSKRWAAANPEKKRAMWRARRARKRNAPGSHTAADIASIAKAQRDRCAYCRTQITEKSRHVDHIVALSRCGTDDRRNLQLLCQPCNQAKHAKDPIDFAREIGRLC